MNFFSPTYLVFLQILGTGNHKYIYRKLQTSLVVFGSMKNASEISGHPLDLWYCHPPGNTVEFLLLLSEWIKNTSLRNLPAPPHPNQAKCISRFSSNYSIPIPHHTFKHTIRNSHNKKRKYQELMYKFARNSTASQVSFQRHLVTPRMMEFNPGHKPPQVTIAAFTCGTPVNLLMSNGYTKLVERSNTSI